MDNKTSPCDDLFQHACGRWIATHHSENRGFSGLAAVNHAQIKAIIANESNVDVHAFYKSCVVSLVDSHDRRKRRRQQLEDAHISRTALLVKMLDPLVTVSDLPVVFALMNAQQFKVPVAFSISSHPKDNGTIPLFSFDGFDSAEHDLEWVRMHFEVLYGTEGSTAVDEAKRFIEMSTKLNLMRPPAEDYQLNTYSGWKQYVSGDGSDGHASFDRDTMTWSEFQTLSNSPFDWALYLRTLAKETELEDTLTLHPNDRVWAISRGYFEWFHPELFTPEQWKTYITFSVLYHSHDFFPELPDDVLLHKGLDVGRRSQVTRYTNRSPLRDGENRRPKKLRLSAATYAIPAMPHLKWFGHRHAAQRRSLTRAEAIAASRRHLIPSPFAVGEGVQVTSDDCLAAVKYLLPGLLSKEFLRTNFDSPQHMDTARRRISAIVDSIKDRFIENLNTTRWMDTETRQNQVTKIRSIISRIIQPNNEWSEERFPAGKHMDPDRYLRNLLIIQAERVRRNLALWRPENRGQACGDVCRDRLTFFGSPLYTVNAWYNPDRNTITVPAGFVGRGSPFFNLNMTDTRAWATIGWVVGHELAHSMDEHGKQYDAHGLMRETWSEQASAEYRDKAMCIVNEFERPQGCPEGVLDTNRWKRRQDEPEHAYGKQTVAENTADFNGVQMAFEALCGGTEGSACSEEQIREFSLAAAQMWCASFTVEEICQKAAFDPHSPANMRVRKTLAHMPFFARAFQCPVGSPMHRQDHERCVMFGPPSLVGNHGVVNEKANAERAKRVAVK